MGDLEPITRNEKLWSGEDLTPVTRKEMYIKHLYDETQVIPEYPVTREEMFILKAGEELHDVTIEQLTATENKTYSEKGVAYSPVIVNVPAPVLDELTVTENGTYTPPSGTDGYDEVTVDVPLPENAYLLKEIEDVEIASFPDGSDLPMPKLEVAIEPVQEGSGDPSPENVRPIIGWDEVNVTRTGKNLWDIDSCENGYLNESGVFVPHSGFYCTPYLNVKPNITYSLAYNRIGTSGGGGMRIAWYDKNKTFIRRDGYIETTTIGDKIITETAPSNAYYCRCSLVGSQEKYMLVIGTITDLSSYTPYNPNSTTYTIDLDGTRYGGKVDLVSGVMTVDRMLVDMGTLNWSIVSWQDVNYIVSQTIRNVCVKPSSDNIKGNILCSNYPNIPRSSISTTTDKIISLDANGNINVIDSNYATASDFTTAMNGVQLVYELATPITIQLSPTVVKSLRGKNNVWADTGNILDLSYLAKEE